ncbi:serine/threonine-protein kinase [Streptomyces vietnamensis]|uniref:serine/threonine-protein kinase n=1 Tax=Streptomyces vietnamensis TaxID=362257 RepID=UPI000AAACE97|nr:serine/threonine-protein kinase [Streptomyces vietnamensis]
MSAQLPGSQPAYTHVALTADDPREIGGYHLQARLGAGGMGVVYLAHTPGGRPIALKVVREEFAGDPEFRLRFAQEVASAERIHGLFTAQVVASGVDAPTPWFATAYIPGPSLQQVVQRHGPLPVRTVLLLMAGVAEALQAIHGAGVVHRDLKPANVLIAEDGPRVIDFGIARAADAVALTGVGLSIGTAAYMAPEQALGRPVSPATDVFALGALIAYVASGETPFGAGPESAALYRVVHEQPDLARVPHDLRDLLAWCLAKRPEDRPTTADLIAAVHAHPLVGGRPEFAEGWLPQTVSSEVAGRGARPAPVHAQPTLASPAAVSTPTPFPAAAAVSTPAPFPAPAPPSPRSGAADAPVEPSRRRARKGRRRLIVAVLAVLAVLGAAGGVVRFLGARADDAGYGPSYPPADSYVSGGKEVELTLPDDTYEFDLKSGKVVPADTAAWYLARDRSEFVLPEDSDAFVSPSEELSPADCVRGIDTDPATRIAFADLADERPFCVRSSDGKGLVVVRLIEAQADGGRVTAAFERYRSDQ